jgi:hypothetical protein
MRRMIRDVDCTYTIGHKSQYLINCLRVYVDWAGCWHFWHCWQMHLASMVRQEDGGNKIEAGSK